MNEIIQFLQERRSITAKKMEAGKIEDDHITNIIIPFFEKYSLQTVKNIDFFSFRRIINKMNSKRHMSLD